MKLTTKDRARNRKSTRYETLHGQRKCLIEWCEHYGQSYDRVQKRLGLGWPLERALTQAGRAALQQESTKP